MPVTIDWGNPQQTHLHAKFIHPWNAVNFHEIYDKGYALVDSVDHTVDILVDFTENQGHLPANVLSLFRRAQDRHPRTGRFIVVSPRLMLAKMFIRLVQQTGILSSIYFAKSLDEGYAILNEVPNGSPENF